jgi:hypothetical protein
VQLHCTILGATLYVHVDAHVPKLVPCLMRQQMNMTIELLIINVTYGILTLTLFFPNDMWSLTKTSMLCNLVQCPT